MGDTDWMNGGGEVARKTNDTIDALLEWFEKRQDVERITRKNIVDAINHIADVHSEGTVDRYVKKIVKHGPFERVDGNLYEVTTDAD